MKSITLKTEHKYYNATKYILLLIIMFFLHTLDWKVYRLRIVHKLKISKNMNINYYLGAIVLGMYKTYLKCLIFQYSDSMNFDLINS